MFSYLQYFLWQKSLAIVLTNRHSSCAPADKTLLWFTHARPGERNWSCSQPLMGTPSSFGWYSLSHPPLQLGVTTWCSPGQRYMRVSLLEVCSCFCSYFTHQWKVVRIKHSSLPECFHTRVWLTKQLQPLRPWGRVREDFKLLVQGPVVTVWPKQPWIYLWSFCHVRSLVVFLM